MVIHTLSMFENESHFWEFSHIIFRFPILGSLAIPGHSGDHGYGKAGGAKNLRVAAGHHNRLTLATYNGRTLRLN